MHANSRGVRLSQHRDRIAPAVVLPVGEQHDYPPAAVAGDRLARQQVVGQREPLAQGRHPLSPQNLVVDHVDVPQQVLVVEGERADDVRVVRKDDEADSVVVAVRHEAFDGVLRRFEPGLGCRANGLCG